MSAPSPTGNFTPCSIIDIAAVLGQHLQTFGVCAPSQFVVTCLPPEDVPHTTGDFDVLFVIGGETPDVKVIDGAGRNVNLRTREITLVARSRVLLDPVGSDQLAMLDVGTGHVQLEDSICNACEIYWPMDEAGNPLAVQPIRLGRLAKARKEKQHPEWIYSEWEVSVPYIRQLSSSIS